MHTCRPLHQMSAMRGDWEDEEDIILDDESVSKRIFILSVLYLAPALVRVRCCDSAIVCLVLCRACLYSRTSTRLGSYLRKSKVRTNLALMYSHNIHSFHECLRSSLHYLL